MFRQQVVIAMIMVVATGSASGTIASVKPNVQVGVGLDSAVGTVGLSEACLPALRAVMQPTLHEVCTAPKITGRLLAAISRVNLF